MKIQTHDSNKTFTPGSMTLRTLCLINYRFLTTANCFVVKFYFRLVNTLYFVKPLFLMGAVYVDVNSLKQAAGYCG